MSPAKSRYVYMVTCTYRFTEVGSCPLSYSYFAARVRMGC